MERSVVRRSGMSPPPMHAWPKPIKLMILTLVAVLCVAAYGALAAVVVGAFSLLLTLH